MDEENKLKCDKCGELKGEEPCGHNKSESEPAHMNELVCINKKCENFNKILGIVTNFHIIYVTCW